MPCALLAAPGCSCVQLCPLCFVQCPASNPHKLHRPFHLARASNGLVISIRTWRNCLELKRLTQWHSVSPWQRPDAEPTGSHPQSHRRRLARASGHLTTKSPGRAASQEFSCTVYFFHNREIQRAKFFFFFS